MLVHLTRMRVTSGFWVAALLKRIFSAGGFGAVLKHGGDSAGAIFVVERNRLGLATLYGPAPQSGYDDARPDDRLFIALVADVEEDALSARLAREERFDPDLWVIEVEPTGPISELIHIMTA